MPVDVKSFEQMVDDILDRIVQADIGITDIGNTSKLRVIIESIVSEMDIQNYILSYIYDAFNTDNLSGEHLEKRVADIGIYRGAGTKAVGKVTFFRTTPATSEIIINEGTRVSTSPDSDGNITTFIVVGNHLMHIGSTMIEVDVICDTIGYRYIPIGAINVMMDPVIGINSVSNTQPINGGSDVENDDSLRERYYARLRLPATSGNIHHYIQWARDVNGVGNARVIPLWDGRGTVKVIITGHNGTVADPSIVQNTFDYIESVRPINVDVTVVSATELPISIKADVKLTSGYTLEQVTEIFTDRIEEYRQKISFNTDYVSYSAIGNILFNTEGVEDYTGLLLNNTSGNIPLAVDQIPTFQSIELAVMV